MNNKNKETSNGEKVESPDDGPGNKKRTFIDSEKVKRLHASKAGVSQKKMASHLGIGLTTYQHILWTQEQYEVEIEKKFKAHDLLGAIDKKTKKKKKFIPQKPPLYDVTQFFEIAKKLGVDPIDIVKDDYEFRDKFFHIDLKELKTPEAFHNYLFQFEEKYGRVTVWNTFPSSIYYRKDICGKEIESAKKRYELLALSTHEDLTASGIKNREYYSINAVLEFALNVFHRFSREEKINILDEMIHAFAREEGTHLGNEHKVLKFFDPDTAEYHHNAPTCIVIHEINTALMPSSTHKNDILVIRSSDFVTKMEKYGGMGSKKIIETNDCVILLKIIKDYLSTNSQSINIFAADITQCGSNTLKKMIEKKLEKYTGQ